MPIPIESRDHVDNSKSLSILDLYCKGANIWLESKQNTWICSEISLSKLQDNTLELHVINQDDSMNADTNTINYILKIPLNTTNWETKLPYLCNPSIHDYLDDLTQMTYLNEPSIVHTLKKRYFQDSIYTYSGLVLIAINPFKNLPIYDAQVMLSYMGHSSNELEPHLFAIAESAYRCMTRSDPSSSYSKHAQNQSIIISGESGSGKTESAKYIMRYLASIQTSNSNMTASIPLEEIVLATNPILESFGNARTLRNDNSSRFGKFLQIHFDKSGCISGASILTFLLEKSRVCIHSQNERNYHIFYQILSSESLKKCLNLDNKTYNDFQYLLPHSESDANIDSIDTTINAMKLIGISQEEQIKIFKVLASILHLGNIKIANSNNDQAYIDITDPHLQSACSLLQLEPDLLRNSLMFKSIVIGTNNKQESFKSPLDIQASQTLRDSYSKWLYESLFHYIVSRMNKILLPSNIDYNWIGVLDIYGFEQFGDKNSFEQFCINYANEKLQQEFQKHIFRNEQELYQEEGIDWSFIHFRDNQSCLNMIEGKLGILDLLDEEAKLQTGSNSSLFTKIDQMISSKYQDLILLPKNKPNTFQISHFAYPVLYQVSGFVEKNRDSIPESFHSQLSSSNSFVKEIVISREGKKTTLGSFFKKSLHELMNLLSTTRIHYVRCIKPSQLKQPLQYDEHQVLQQLCSCGVLETIKMSCVGFPARMTFEEFIERYYILNTKSNDDKEFSKNCLKQFLSKDQYQIGKTRIFFRSGAIAFIEQARREKSKQICILIQSNLRGLRYRDIIQSYKQFVIHIGIASRAFIIHETFSMIRCAIDIMSVYCKRTLEMKRIEHISTTLRILQCNIKSKKVIDWKDAIPKIVITEELEEMNEKDNLRDIIAKKDEMIRNLKQEIDRLVELKDTKMKQEHISMTIVDPSNDQFISESDAEYLLSDTVVENELLENLIMNVRIQPCSLDDNIEDNRIKQQVLFPLHLLIVKSQLLYKHGYLDRLSSMVDKTLQTIRLAILQIKRIDIFGMDFNGESDSNIQDIVVAAYEPWFFWTSFLYELLIQLDKCLRTFSILVIYKQRLLSKIEDTIMILLENGWCSQIERSIHSIKQQSIMSKLFPLAILDHQNLYGSPSSSICSISSLQSQSSVSPKSWFVSLFGSFSPKEDSSINKQISSMIALDHLILTLDKIIKTMKRYFVPKHLIEQMMCCLICSHLNSLILQIFLRSRGFICWKRGMYIQYNLTRLEEWMARNNLSSEDASANTWSYSLHISFGKLSQIVKLMQWTSKLSSFPIKDAIQKIFNICSLLSPQQIYKIISSYQPSKTTLEDPISPLLLFTLESIVKKTAPIILETTDNNFQEQKVADHKGETFKVR